MSYLVVVIIAAIAVRFAYTVTQCETAVGVLLMLVQDSTLGWFGWQHKPIHDAESSQQADFWLAEVDRIFQEQPTSEMACAAAWLLDSPVRSIQARNLRVTGIPQVPVLPDSEAISRAESAFEAKAAPACIALAELATQTAPHDVQAWRDRALLLFGPPFGKNEDLPRDPNWRDVLSRAAEHDPDNALYDYLVADRLWQESIDHDFTEDDFPLIVRDTGKFAESTAFFERAQQKQFVRGPDGDSRAVQNLLSRAAACPGMNNPFWSTVGAGKAL